MSNTFLTIDAEKGGDAVFTVNATEDWYFVQDENWPEVVKFAKDENGKTYKASHDKWGNLTNAESEIDSKTTAWLTTDVLKGGKGETKVTLHADATKVGREIELRIVTGDKSIQFVKVRQGDMSGALEWPGKANAIVGATYLLKNVTVSALGNYASYGAFFVTDSFGENVQIYGSTSDSKKNYPDVAVSDVVTFSGVWSSYGNFENAEISKWTPSLLKVLTESKEIAKEGDTFEIKAEFKGEGAYFAVAPECADWVSVTSVTTEKGTPSKLDPDPASIATYTVVVAPNEDAARTGKITLSSGSSSFNYEFKQLGAVISTVAEAVAMENGEFVTIQATVMASGYNAYIVNDGTASLLIYKGKVTPKVGEVYKISGTMGAYNEGRQISEPASEELIEEVTVTYPAPSLVIDGTNADELLATKNLDIQYVKAIGTLSVSGNYYNLMIEGAATAQGSFYALSDAQKASLNGLNGKKVTLVGYWMSISSSKGTPKFLNIMMTSCKEYADGDGELEEPKMVECTLDGEAIKAAHSEAWTYSSGEKLITTGEYTWTAFNTYANANQVTIQINKGKGAYVLTPKVGKITKIAVTTNRKNDGTGDMGDRPLDIMTVDGTVLLDNASGQSLADGMEISGEHDQLKIACDETAGGATYITKITIWGTL
ncbi:MAG: BACON domain-containing protein [Candidatus Cryptobacteroides sp.]